MNDKADRIAKLSQRFKAHATGRPKNTAKKRERQSFYLDATLTDHIDKSYKACHPSVSGSLSDLVG